MQNILTREAMQRLYDEKKTAEALKEIDLALQVWDDPEEAGHLYALKAWCHYQRKEYPECRTAIAAAGNNQKAKECAIHLAAYVDKDDETLMNLYDHLGVSPSSANAFVIRARDLDSKIRRQTVLNNAFGFRENKDVVATHVLNNTARYLIAKPKDDEDLFLALGFLDAALARYGEGDKNLHHRGAVWYWKSKVVQSLIGVEAARNAALESFSCWAWQVSMDPTNQAFQKGFENAKARWDELVG